MELRLRIAQVRPLRGVVAVSGTVNGAAADRPGPVRFAGWLELLRVLGDLLADQPGELEPGLEGQLGEDVRNVGLDRAP